MDLLPIIFDYWSTFKKLQFQSFYFKTHFSILFYLIVYLFIY